MSATSTTKIVRAVKTSGSGIGNIGSSSSSSGTPSKPITAAKPKSTIAKTTTHARPPRAAKTKVINALETYRAMNKQYVASYQRYLAEKQRNPNAVKPKQPNIPEEFRAVISGKEKDDPEETSDEEFEATSESSDDETDAADEISEE